MSGASATAARKGAEPLAARPAGVREAPGAGRGRFGPDRPESGDAPGAPIGRPPGSP